MPVSPSNGAPLVTADKKFVLKARASHALVRVL
jgi:hypothetical protein